MPDGTVVEVRPDGSTVEVKNDGEGTKFKTNKANKKLLIIKDKLKRKTKQVLLNNTRIGRKVRDGYQKAQESASNNFTTSQQDNILQMKAQIKEKLKDMPEISLKLQNDSEFTRLFNSFLLKNAANKPELINMLQNYELSGVNDAQIIKTLIETSGVGVTKFAQIISKDKTIMSNFEKSLPPQEFKNLQQALIECQSKCDFSRSVVDAQEELNKAFPSKKETSTATANDKSGQSYETTVSSEYTILKENSAGSVGATYWALDPNGNKVVVKMLKAGVDMEELGLEEKLFKKLIEVFAPTPEAANKYNTIIHNQYKDWYGELDFKQEGINNRRLTEGAQRYSVAQVQKVSKDGTMLVMDKAKGVQMNKLAEMLDYYKKNGLEKYNEKYKEDLSQNENQWLQNPDNILTELPTTLVKTFDEQMLFVKKGGGTVMHGDPHMGNLFVYSGEDGNLKIEFIDTGNCVVRNSSEIKGDIDFFSNYLVGNAQGVAKYFMKKGGVNPENEPELLKQITDNMNKLVFQKGQNITQFDKVQKELTSILEKAGLDIGTEDSNALKAQLQFISNISTLNALAGKPLDISAMFLDIPKALAQMAKNGINPLSSVKEALTYALHNNVDALGNALQFKIKKATVTTDSEVKPKNQSDTQENPITLTRETLLEIKDLVKNRHKLSEEDFNNKITTIANHAEVLRSQILEHINNLSNN